MCLGCARRAVAGVLAAAVMFMAVEVRPEELGLVYGWSRQ